MKLTILFTAFLVCLIVLVGCETSKVQKDQHSITITLPEDIPSFITEKDFEKIDWNRKATELETGTGSVMFGNKNKLGIIGPELTPNNVEKWLWHFWGIEKGELTVVGYNQDNSKISTVFSGGYWSRNGIGGSEINGADASLPSNVMLPDAGKWALLVYIDGKLFDILVIDVQDK
ncbi:hypothetical protein VBD025_15565 [Virgibacillus flavescens]|uniref:hypothetical protein n=1 Tax=Virgibacillus flavescens TaxID=1611422 RepID=UPI003D359165